MLLKIKTLPPLVDTHSHILPGVDDGARNLDDALLLLKEAVKDGVMIQVLTPHIHARRYDNTRQSLLDRFREFRDKVHEARIAIELHLAGEVRICPEIPEMLDAEQIPWLGSWNGYRTFLLELPLNSIPAGSDKLVEWLRHQGVLPIIVHPERNAEIQAKPNKLRPFIELGCPIQITAASLLGRFGVAANKVACELLLADQVDTIASDCHNLRYRPPILSQGVKQAAKLIGHAKAVRLAVDRPLELMGAEAPSRDAL